MWLSGGLDSSTILHYASRASSARLKTFSISFRGRSFDESSYIQNMVSEYGTEHDELDLNPEEDLNGAIQEFAYYSDEPSADAGALPLWFLAKLSRTQTEVALSGEGADELFGGYLTYRASRIASHLRQAAGEFAATGAVDDAGVAGVRRQDRTGIQGQAAAGGQSDVAGARPCLLERNVLRSRRSDIWWPKSLPPALDRFCWRAWVATGDERR